jgi:hypothetical protein
MAKGIRTRDGNNAKGKWLGAGDVVGLPIAHLPFPILFVRCKSGKKTEDANRPEAEEVDREETPRSRY